MTTLKRSLILVFGLMCFVNSLASQSATTETAKPAVFRETRRFGKAVRALDRKITVPAGSSFVIVLSGSPTTGYLWSHTNVAGLTLLTPADPNGEGKFIPNKLPPGYVGGGGKHQFQFTAKDVGTEVLEFVYKRPWLPNALFTYKVEVTIK